MGLADKLSNKRKNTVREGIDTKEIEYISAASLADFAPEAFPLKLVGFFIKDGDYGKQVTVIAETDVDIIGIDLPKRYVDMFEDLTPEEIEDIKEGKLAISGVEGDVKTPKGKTTMIEFTDLE